MHAMQTPKNWNGMEHYMLQIDNKVERNKGRDELDARGNLKDIEQTPAPLFGDECEAYGGKWKGEAK